MPKRKITLTIATIVLIVITLTGCSGSSSKTPGSNPVTITYVVPNSWANVGAFKDNVAAYEKQSENKVEVQGIPDEQFETTVQTRLAAGDGIDAFPSTKYNDIDDPDSVLVEITKPSFTSRMEPAVLNGLKAKNGKYYGYPTADPLSTFGIFYNKDVFAKADVTIPTKLTEFSTAIAAIKATGITPLFLSGKDGWTLLQHRNAVNANLLSDSATIVTSLATNTTK